MGKEDVRKERKRSVMFVEKKERNGEWRCGKVRVKRGRKDMCRRGEEVEM